MDDQDLLLIAVGVILFFMTVTSLFFWKIYSTRFQEVQNLASLETFRTPSRRSGVIQRPDFRNEGSFDNHNSLATNDSDWNNAGNRLTGVPRMSLNRMTSTLRKYGLVN